MQPSNPPGTAPGFVIPGAGQTVQAGAGQTVQATAQSTNSTPDPLEKRIAELEAWVKKLIHHARTSDAFPVEDSPEE